MKFRHPVLAHALAALVVAAAGLSGGVLLAFVSAPIAALLAAQSVMGSGDSVIVPRYSVGLGLVSLGFAVLLFLASHLGAALLVVLAAAVVMATAIDASLRMEPPSGPESEVDGFDLRLGLGVVADEALRCAIELRQRMQPGPEFTQMAGEVRIAADRNHEEGWIARPERAHPIPPPLEKPVLRRTRIAGVGDAELLCFPSEFVAQDPEFDFDAMAGPSNRVARATLFRDSRRPRPTVIFLHDFGFGRPAIDAQIAGVAGLRSAGFDVALLTLPLHGARSSGWTSENGFLGGSVLATNAAVAQSVWDGRCLAGWLGARGVASLAFFGIGLGGYVTALVASLHEGLAAAIIVGTPAALDSCFWRQMPPHRIAQLQNSGLTAHVLDHAWARHAPLRVRPRVAHEGRLVVGNTADRIVPPSEIERLWQHWGQPASLWDAGTHCLWRDPQAIRNRIVSHLKDHLFDTH